jgi:putative transposase
MRRAVSPGAGRRYPLTMICTAWRMPRSTVYLAMAAAPGVPVFRAKRGPKTAVSDSAIITAIRAVLSATPFHGEGYRKIRARLAHRGFAIGGKRVLRLLRQHQLLAPAAPGAAKWGSSARRHDHHGAAR